MADYLEVSIRCAPVDEDLVTSFITETLSQGLVTEVSDNEFKVKFYLPVVEESREKVEMLGVYLVSRGLTTSDGLTDMISIKPIDDIDWIKSFQQSFQPVVVDNVAVRSIWDKTHFPGKVEIVIEPKMAFGTGQHETTQLCMAQLIKDIKPGDKVLDLGCGSGILGILAAKIGAAECLGLDIDLAAIDNAKENVVHNNVQDVVKVQFGSMDRITQIAYYDVVVSNLIKDEIFNLYENFMRCLKPEGILILSGILTEQEEEFHGFLKLKNPHGCLVTRKTEWICCRVTKA
ncbi:MAG: 50S ribosomal protein L11 methyltransferase [candidate division Zixibacteria bacterium]|nr:50S ribosomal protein L11 methyltransferase [candidate division Zixibacteria bacterium]